MKILSFDVGIKNLSFCLLNDTVIENWGILNISADNILSYLCLNLEFNYSHTCFFRCSEFS